ncbi:HD domain-containing phosphohydrolase [Halanaerobium hydrogeniformans]|uniref:HD domain-containing phosphohydrolase n=1 Tax=Halanaerobium hydrogeniformans TaxID=656519 RepID=UPI000A03E523
MHSSEEFSIVAEEILTHHEKWDGSGYPKGLSGKNIPYLARIISIVDAYDVMISGRPYQEKMTEEETLAEIEAAARSQFDPDLVKKFLEFIK